MIMSLGLHWWFKLPYGQYIFKMVKHTTFDKTLEDLETNWWYTWILIFDLIRSLFRSAKSKGGLAEGSSSFENWVHFHLSSKLCFIWYMMVFKFVEWSNLQNDYTNYLCMFQVKNSLLLGEEKSDFDNLLSCLVNRLHLAWWISASKSIFISNVQGGKGLHATINSHSKKFAGILNGIDTAAWNPASDNFLKVQYSASDIDGKIENKEALRRLLGLSSSDFRQPLVRISLFIIKLWLAGYDGSNLFISEWLWCQYYTAITREYFCYFVTDLLIMRFNMKIITSSISFYVKVFDLIGVLRNKGDFWLVGQIYVKCQYFPLNVWWREFHMSFHFKSSGS